MYRPLIFLNINWAPDQNKNLIFLTFPIFFFSFLFELYLITLIIKKDERIQYKDYEEQTMGLLKEIQ